MMRAVCYDVIELGIQLSNACREGKYRQVENVESTCYSLILEMKTKRERTTLSSFLLESVNELVCDNIPVYLRIAFYLNRWVLRSARSSNLSNFIRRKGIASR